MGHRSSPYAIEYGPFSFPVRPVCPWRRWIVATRLDGPRCHLVRRYRPRLRPHFVR